MVSKLNLVVIVASIAGGVLWIEHGHRIDIETTTGAAAFTAPVPAVCPASENVPYSADCIAFMQGDVASDVRWRVTTATSMPAAAPYASGSAESSGPACPANNENVPYSAQCLRFLSGWFWRPNLSESATPAAPK